MESKKPEVEVRRTSPGDREWVRQVLEQCWYSTKIVSKSRIHDADQLSGFIAEQSGVRVGLVLYEIANGECEIVTLNSFTEFFGVGSSLIDAVKFVAMASNCRRLWLTTTNDNTQALRFYQKRGFVLTAIYLGAIENSRKLKPNIPMIGYDGIPVKDEIELEMPLEHGVAKA